MLVRAIMTPERDLTVLRPSQTLEEALNKINELGFLSLPVVEEGKFVGYISSFYLYRKFVESGEPVFADFLRANIIEDFVDTSVEPPAEMTYVEEAAEAFSFQYAIH